MLHAACVKNNAAHEGRRQPCSNRSRQNCAHLDGCEDGRNVVDGAPLVLKDVQADAAIRIDCSRRPSTRAQGSATGGPAGQCAGDASVRQPTSGWHRPLTVGVEHACAKLHHWRLVGVVLHPWGPGAEGSQAGGTAGRTAVEDGGTSCTACCQLHARRLSARQESTAKERTAQSASRPCRRSGSRHMQRQHRQQSRAAMAGSSGSKKQQRQGQAAAAAAPSSSTQRHLAKLHGQLEHASVPHRAIGPKDDGVPLRQLLRQAGSNESGCQSAWAGQGCCQRGQARAGEPRRCEQRPWLGAPTCMMFSACGLAFTPSGGSCCSPAQEGSRQTGGGASAAVRHGGGGGLQRTGSCTGVPAGRLWSFVAACGPCRAAPSPPGASWWL